MDISGYGGMVDTTDLKSVGNSLGGSSPPIRTIWPVVQWLELTAHNGAVAGSNPAGPTNLENRHGS